MISMEGAGVTTKEEEPTEAIGEAYLLVGNK
jgi:hypothetical protein